ncbi:MULTISPECIES: GNAT family N-acetyltransferase [Bacillus]|uniref:GNAT family N-acetyltransferase n=1 Tax=Bacillus TaxID=1386 RepID=UPI000BB9A0E3|nr:MULTISPECIES: GNAT family N-acetyltransferase [Bacillus]
MLYTSGKLTVRLLEDRDKELLVKWLSDPRVLEYYEGRDNPHDLDMVNESFYDETDGVNGCLVGYNDSPIGYIQFYEVDPKYRMLYGYEDDEEIIYGMDQFIGEVDYWNKGIGTLLVSSMVDYLSTNKKASKVVMDPQTWNERAIKCYEKCGFQKIKLLPKQEYHEGEYRDCWQIEYSTKDAEN